MMKYIPLKKVINLNNFTAIGKRNFGSHSSKPSGAHLFGIDPSKKYKYEGWEFITFATYIISVGVIAFGYSSSTTDFKVKLDNSFLKNHFKIYTIIFSLVLGKKGSSCT